MNGTFGEWHGGVPAMERVGDEGEILLFSFPLKFPPLAFFHLATVNTSIYSGGVQSLSCI